MDASRDLGWIAGIFDGEGTVSGGVKVSRRVSITNTDLHLIKESECILNSLGIETKLYSHTFDNHWKECWTLTVYGRANLIAFYEKIPFRSKDKRLKLETMIQTYRRGERWMPQEV